MALERLEGQLTAPGAPEKEKKTSGWTVAAMLLRAPNSAVE